MVLKKVSKDVIPLLAKQHAEGAERHFSRELEKVPAEKLICGHGISLAEPCIICEYGVDPRTYVTQETPDT